MKMVCTVINFFVFEMFRLSRHLIYMISFHNCLDTIIKTQDIEINQSRYGYLTTCSCAIGFNCR